MNKEIFLLDPHTIQTNRPNRQRKEINISDILPSIKENGIIEPIIIRRSDFVNDKGYFDTILVAGERRLEACKELKIQVPCIYKNDLSEYEAQIIEFDENHKRKNLTWREEVQAVGTIYNLSQKQTPPQSKQHVARNLSLSEQKLDQMLHLYRFLDEKILSYAENITQAINLLHKFKSEKSEKIKSNLSQILTKQLPDHLQPLKTQPLKLNFKSHNTSHVTPIPITHRTSHVTPPHVTRDPILNLDFKSWINDYSGPKFNFIHCDFPESERNFNQVFESFISNRAKLLDENGAHILFWFKMENYREIKGSLDTYFPNEILPRPLIWFKSNIKQNNLTASPPRNTYESAFIINYNSRPFLRQIQDTYNSPHTTQPICPNQKSIPMLKYFFQTFVDSNTNVFDPTCGSGSSLIASELLNCKSILGLEINPLRAQKANEKINREREIRNLLEK